MKKVLIMLLMVVIIVGFGPITGISHAAKAADTEDKDTQIQPGGADFKLSKLLNKSVETDTKAPKEMEVIVQFEDAASAELSNAEVKKIETIQAMSAAGSSGKSKVEIADGITVNKGEIWEFEADEEGGDPVTVAVASSDTLSTSKIIRKLQSEKIIKAVSPNYSRHIYAEDYSAFQWSLGDYPGISVDTEWSSGNTGSDENIVAVVDTGIYYEHDDLKGKIWTNPFGAKLKGSHGFDFANGDTNPIDDHGHGTHCAGIIGAVTEDGNNIGIQGVDPSVKMMALKVLDGGGEGYDSDIIAAYNYIYKAMELGANVVAINCSFGGEDRNDIMEEVINKVGEKGAVSVCAAGNEGVDNDEEPSYPACYDSEYIISVAATKDSGDKAELVSYSNYGKDTVDIAAPGTDILSSVSYDCFNPTIYRDNSEFMDVYLDGSTASAEALTDSQYSNLTSADIASVPSAGFYSDDGALKIEFSQDAAKNSNCKWQYAAVPYDIPEECDMDETDVASSMMIRTEGPEDLTIDEFFSGTFKKVMVLDIPRALLDKETKAGAEFFSMGGEEILDDYFGNMQLVYGNDDYWTHLTTDLTDAFGNGLVNIKTGEDQEVNERERAIVIIGDTQTGDFTAYIDDIGISKPVTDTSVFGMYDFMSGTSMAAPCVTGAVSLTAAADKAKEGYGPEMVIGDVLSACNDKDALKVSTDGTIDFASKGTGFWIGISSVSVDVSKDLITLKGNFKGFDLEKEGSENLVVKIRTNDEKDARVVPKENYVTVSDSQIVLRNDKWINNIVDVTVTGTIGDRTKSATKKDVYLVKGKKEYEVLSEGEGVITPDASLTTNGKKVFAALSMGDTIMSTGAAASPESVFEIACFDKDFVEENFKEANPKKRSKTAEYDFRFGDDLVLIGGNLYVTGSFCEVAPVGYDDEEDWSNGKVGTYAVTSDDDRFGDSNAAAYTEETYIFRINISSGVITKLKSPAGLDMLTDVKLASFNGSLYMLGGINESENAFSSKVYKYSGASKKWIAAAALPQGRAGGKVLQTGNKLVYTLGYGAESCLSGSEEPVVPANFIFDGKAWKKSSASLEPIVMNTVSRGDEDYVVSVGSVGICQNGLVYIAAPAEDYGDTFTYDINSDKFVSTDYNYAKTLRDVFELSDGFDKITGLAVGGKVFGYDADGDVLVVKDAIKSGLIKVTAGKLKTGKITGAGYYMPGAVCTVKALANPGYYVKSLTLPGASGKKVMSRGMYASVVVTKAITAKAQTGKVSVQSADKLKIKRGKSKVLKATLKPAAAAKQWKLKYKSSNSKYAVVNAAGKVTAKKAGKGKTVKISIMLKGTNKTLKTVKVKIK